MVREFEQRRKEIHNLNEVVRLIYALLRVYLFTFAFQYEANKGKFETFEARVQILRDEWLQPLGELIGKINRSYGDFFARLDCAGEVSLLKPEVEVGHRVVPLRI